MKPALRQTAFEAGLSTLGYACTGSVSPAARARSSIAITAAGAMPRPRYASSTDQPASSAGSPSCSRCQYPTMPTPSGCPGITMRNWCAVPSRCMRR